MASSKIAREDATVVGMASTVSRHSNITNVERFVIGRTGRMVVIEMTFTVGTTISDNQAILFSGLPKAKSFTRFRIPNGYDSTKPPLVLGITTDGSILNQWSYGGVQSGQWAGQFSYICE